MKIGLFTDAYAPAVSGVVTSVQMLSDGLEKLGHTVYIFTVQMKEKTVDEKNVVRFKGYTVWLKGLTQYKLASKLNRKARQIKRKFDLDIIHIHTEFSMGKLGTKVAKKMNIPYVYTFHTMYEEYLPYISKYMDKHYHESFFNILRRMFVNPISDNAKTIIVPTKKVYNQAENYKLVGDIQIVPTGLELDKFNIEISNDDIKQIKEKYNLTNKLIFLSLGRVSKEKSIDSVIKSYALSQKGKNSVLLIVGDGPHMSELKKLVNKLEIEQQVVFTGFIKNDEIVKIYKASDVFVNASTSETQGLTYIEALASSLPILVQKDECLEGVVEDGVNSILFDGEIELASKMDIIYENPDILRNIRCNCAKSVEKYSKMCYASSVEEIYKKVVSNR